MEEKNTDMNSDDKKIVYKRQRTLDVIEHLKPLLQRSLSENDRVRLEYVLAILSEGSKYRHTILLRNPGDLEDIERRLSLPELADDSFEWSRIRREYQGEAPVATYVLYAEPPDEPPLPASRVRTR